MQQYYQTTDSGNWESGKNILYRKTRAEESTLTNQVANSPRIVLESRKKLLQARTQRTRPSLDDKVLVAWNAIMLRGYIDAYFALGRPEYLEAALKNAKFLEKNMIRKDDGLWRNYSNGKPEIEAFLDDYALMARAFIQLYQATFDIHWLNSASTITRYAVDHFRNPGNGLFYYSADKSENIVARKVEVFDNVIPSSNSVLAEDLFLIGHYFDVDSLIQMSSFMLSGVSQELGTNGVSFANWVKLLALQTYQPFEVAVVGEDALEKSREMLRHFLPRAIFMGGIKTNIPLLENKIVAHRTIIYVCSNKICKVPEENVARAIRQID
jgi:uncharacterized protein YyaL (SSP411 family)